MAAPTRLVILAKPPQRGRAKNRLAAEVGEGRAARLARAMLLDGWRIATEFAGWIGGIDTWLLTSGDDEDYPLLQPAPYRAPQAEGDLGRRMAAAMADALQAGHERVLILGTDAPCLPDRHLRDALALLDDHDLVVGPMRDGGFWCLGARASATAVHDPTWLDELDWERDATRLPVLARAEARGLSVAEADEWFDVDHARDLVRLREVMSRNLHRAPELRRVLESHGDAEPLSIIVASLDEGHGLDACIDALRSQPGPNEIIVADGGSRDGSAERVARQPGVVVVRSAPGRGRQFAAGARTSTGNPLLFLHTDTRLPHGATDEVHRVLRGGHAEAGAFITRTRPDPSLPNPWGPLLRVADIRSRITRHPYGDQGLFVTREAYEEVGGFRPLPIMEDYDLSVRLAARRPLARVHKPVSVSGRRMQRAPLRSMVLMRVIPPLYRLGVSPERLAKMYRGG